MKKNYVLGVFVLAATFVSAQVTSTEKVGRMPSLDVKSSKVVQAAPSVQKALIAGPFTFGGTETWNTSTALNGDAWVVGTAAPSGSYSVSMGAIASTTAGDNFAMFDSDELGEDNGGTTPQNADIWYTTSFDLSSNLAVALEFESYYRAFQGDCYVIASTDGVNWTQFPVHADIAVNASTANPALTSVNISSAVGGSPTAYIGFRYIGTWDYAWMVDDVSLVTLPDDDLGLLKAWQGDIINDYEYSRIPLTQTKEIVAGVVVQNQGGQPQTVDLSWEVTMNGTGTGTNGIQNITVAVGETDTIWINTGYTPSANGTYAVDFSVPADMDATDDMVSSADLIVNDNVMGHDYGATGSYGWNPTTSPDNANAPHAWGNIYIPTVSQDIYGIDVNFAASTTPGLYLLARVQQVPSGGSIQDPLTMIAQMDHTIQASEIGSAITTIVFPSPATLIAGEAYIIDIFKVDGTTGEQFRVGGSDVATEDDDFSTVCYGPYGANDAVNYYVSWQFAPLVRANFDQTLSVKNNEENGVFVYPNPTSGVINVTNASGLNNVISVIDVTGKELLSKTVSTGTTLDLSSFGTGIYLVKVSNEKGQIVERVVVR